MITFTNAELEIIARLTGNLLGSAFEAGLDPGVLESLYYKTSQHLAGLDAVNQQLESQRIADIESRMIEEENSGI